MSSFSKRSQAVSPSLTLSLTAKAGELRAQGIDVISFGVGEPDFNTPEYIVAAAKKALDLGLTKYTAVAGTTGLRNAIVRKLLRDNGLTYSADRIVVSSGAKQSLFNAVQLLVDEGDEVIIPTPYWLTYPELVTMCGGRCVFVDALQQDGFILQPENLQRAITHKTKALILNSPNNPTGAVYTRQQLEALAQVLRRHPDIWVISDEIYEKLIYGDMRHCSMANIDGMYDSTLVINGFSKAYAMTGWRMGYCAAPTVEAAKKMSNLQSHQTSNPNSIAQYACEAALGGGEEFLEEMKETFCHRRDVMLSGLNKIKGMSAVRADGAFYIMVNVSQMYGKRCGCSKKPINSAAEFASALLEERAVVTIPCEGFGAPDFIRLSYATDEQTIRKGIDRLNEFILSLKD